MCTEAYCQRLLVASGIHRLAGASLADRSDGAVTAVCVYRMQRIDAVAGVIGAVSTYLKEVLRQRLHASDIT